MRKWRVIRWDDRPTNTKLISYSCTHCGGDFDMPINAADLVIAQLGQGVVCDHHPSPNMMPDVIQCPKCKRVLERTPS